MAHSPWHAAAYALDPEFWPHLRDLQEDGEVLTGLKTAFQTLGEADAAIAAEQFDDYRLKHNVFAAANKAMWSAAPRLTAYRWWYTYAKGPSVAVLQKLAMRLLACPTSSSSMERTWSSYEFIHNRRRNRLQVGRADKLVSVFTNMQLKRRIARNAAKGEQDPKVPWMWFVDDEEMGHSADELEDVEAA